MPSFLCISCQISELWLGLKILQGGVLALATCLLSFVRYWNWTLPSIGSTEFGSLLSFFDDQQTTVHAAMWKAFDSFVVKSTPKDELEPLVVPLCQTIESTGSPGHTIPGFNLPKEFLPKTPMIS